MAWQGFHN
ncbi:hypothetical protein YPPY101_3300, partial [Yersinia pestis PY-101]